MKKIILLIIFTLFCNIANAVPSVNTTNPNTIITEVTDQSVKDNIDDKVGVEALLEGEFRQYTKPKISYTKINIDNKVRYFKEIVLEGDDKLFNSQHIVKDEDGNDYILIYIPIIVFAAEEPISPVTDGIGDDTNANTNPTAEDNLEEYVHDELVDSGEQELNSDLDNIDNIPEEKIEEATEAANDTYIDAINNGSSIEEAQELARDVYNSYIVIQPIANSQPVNKKSKIDKLMDKAVEQWKKINSPGDINRIIDKYGDVYVTIRIGDSPVYIQHKNEHGKEYTGILIKSTIDINCIIFKLCRR